MSYVLLCVCVCVHVRAGVGLEGERVGEREGDAFGEVHSGAE